MSESVPEVQTPPPEEMSKTTSAIEDAPHDPHDEAQVLSIDTLTPPPETAPSPCAETHKEQIHCQNDLAIGE